MAFNSELAKQLESYRRNPEAQQVQQIWPDESPDGLAATKYPDLGSNPSFDIRHLVSEVEGVARRHWWDKVNKDHGPDDYGQTPDGPAGNWKEAQDGYSNVPPAKFEGKPFDGEPGGSK